MRLTLREYDNIPPWYGIAWVDPCMATAVAYRIPLNFIARWWHGFALWIKYGGRPQRVERTLSEAYERGRQDGLAFVLRLEDLLQSSEHLLTSLDAAITQTAKEKT